MITYGIIETFGKQYLIEEGRFYAFDNLNLKEGEIFYFKKVLFLKYENKILIGKPFLEGNFLIQGKVLDHTFGAKKIVYKMKPKKTTRKTIGSKERVTRVLITRIYEKKYDNDIISTSCFLG